MALSLKKMLACMQNKYTLGQRWMACILLVSLLLQSCSNPYIPNHPIPIKEETTIIGITSQESEEYQEKESLAKYKESEALELIPSSLSEGLTSSQVEEPMELTLSQDEKSLLAPREQKINRITSGAVKPSSSQPRKYPTSSPIQSKLKQEPPKRKPDLAQGNGLQEQKRLDQSRQRSQDQHRTSPAPQDIAEATPKQNHPIPVKQAINPVALSTPTYIVQGEHQVKFRQLSPGKWQAEVEESYLAGFSRKLLLPVFIEIGYDLDKLSAHSPLWHKNHIQVILNKANSYVWIGTRGLLGGMQEEANEPSEEETQEKDPTLVNAQAEAHVAPLVKEGKTEEALSEALAESPNNNASLPAIQLPPVTSLAVDPAKTKLGEIILKLTGAEPDERLNVYYQLSQALQDILAQDKAFQGQWNYLWKQLKEPELLINKKVYESSQTKQGSATEQKAIEKQIFAKYDPIYQELESFKKILAEKFPDQYDLLFGLDRIIVFYNKFRQQVCAALANPTAFHSLVEPKALLMGEWWKGSYYRISQSQAYHLLHRDEDGEIIANNKKTATSTSNHQVSFLQSIDTQDGAVYFKVNNGKVVLNPSREYMLYSLYKRLGIQVPASGLLVLDHVKFKESYESQPFILQASEAIVGLIGEKVLQENHSLQLNKEHFEKQVMGTLLTGPTDGKADNFILTPVGKEQGWVSIDNDEVFQAPLYSGGIHLKSVLLLLPEMRESISAATKTFLKCLHPGMFILAWLADLQNQTLSYEGLKKTLGFYGENTIFLRKGGKLLVKQVEELWQELRLPFMDGSASVFQTVQSLLERLQKFIHQNQNQARSLEDLFAHSYPYVHQRYKYLQEQALHLIEQLQKFVQTNQNQEHNLEELSAHSYPSYVREYYKYLQKQVSKGEPDVLFSPAYHALKLLYEGEEASLPGEKSITPEAAYFLTNKPLPDEKRIIPSVQAYLSRYLQEQPNLDPDTIIKAYSSWLHQTPDPLQKPFICLQAMESLHILQQYGFKQIQDEQAAIELYAKVLPIATQLNQAQAWEKLFDTFATTNAELAWLLSIERHFPRGWEHTQKESQHIKEIRGANIGKRQLSTAMQKSLLDEQSKFKKDLSLSGRSCTNKYPANQPLFYLKKYPEIPGYEYATTAFMRQLGLQAAPHSELLGFYDPIEGVYPVLLTQAIAGKLVYEVWEDDNNFTQLDPYHTGLLMVASMLLNPEDSKEDNFIISEDRQQLIPIDNDHTFLPGAVEVKGRLKVVPELQTKTLAFCLQEMYKPLPTSLVEKLTSMNADLFLKQWLEDLAKVSDKYQNLLPEQKLRSLWEKQGSCLRLPLSKAYIQGLYRKFHLLRTLLLQTPQITPLELLKRLEPYVGKSYEEVSKLPTLKERFQAVSSAYKKKTVQGARMSVATSKQLMEIMEVSQEEIQGELIRCKLGPLGALEELARLRQDKKVQDRRLQDFLRGPIEPLKKFTQADEALLIGQWFESKEPYDWMQLHDSQYLQEKHLTSFNFQNKGSLLTALDLRGAKKLKENSLMALHTYCPNLQYLNISAWPLARLGHFKVPAGLLSTKLVLSQDPIFPCLQRLIIQNCNLLQEINIHLPALESLEAAENRNLNRFSLIAPGLRRLDLTGHQIKQREAFNLSVGSITGLTLQGVDLCQASVVEALQKQQGTKLKLRYKNLDALDLALLVNHAIFKKNKYEEIDLSSNNLGDAEAIELVKHLQGTHVHTINLLSNQISDQGAIELANELAKHLHGTSVRQISLGKNLNFVLHREVILEALQKKQTSQLDLKSKGLHRLDITFLVRYPLFKENKGIYKEIDLSFNNIGDSAAQELAKALPNSKILTLNLTYNQIGDSGAQELAKALPKSQILTLNLGSNQIGASGAQELAKALPNSKILTLDLARNNIGDSGAIELAKALPKSQIHTLNLSSNNIGDSGAQDLAKALPKSQIHTLNLSSNQIGASGAQDLAKALPNSQILTLNLTYNQIGDLGAQELAKALPNSQIHTLNLSSNQIGDSGAMELAKALPNSQIHTLDLHDNNIGASGAMELAKALPNSQIHTLDLGSNQIGASGAQELAKALPKSQIHTLDLANTQIGASGAMELAKALPNSQIHTLDLRYNNIGASGAMELAKALPNSKIHTLDLSLNQIGDSEAQELAKALPKSQIHTLNLRSNTLNLRSNNIGDSGAIELAKALPNSQIHTLHLSLNKIGDSGAQELAKALPNSKIHTLNLERNNIGDSGAQELAKALPKSQIHILDLSNNNIGASGAQELAKALPKSQIHTLHLGGGLFGSNKIGASGAIELAKALPKSQLHTLYLGNNQIGASGAQELAKALSNSKILTLDLGGNKIGASGAIELAKALSNSKIHTLNLERNNIGDSGAQELAKALSKSQIHTLDLGGNHIGDSGAQELAKALPKSQIHTLNLSWNQIGDSGAQELAKALPNSKILTLELGGNKIGEQMQALLRKEHPHINWSF
jgi:Ran GTPase-activating protein (RanGAP) involved in mRNA processing and transport